MRRAEDLIIEDAVSPNILKKMRGGAERLARVLRSSYSDIGSMDAPHGFRSPYWNFITVAKQGGDFQTITEALIAIEDNSALNRYCIFQYPGLFDEQVIHKPYVALVGLDRDVCIIESADYADLVILSSHSSLNETQVINRRADANISAVFAQDITDFFLDSCVVEAYAQGANTAFALNVRSCSDVRILGHSRFYGETTGAGSAYAARFFATAGSINAHLMFCEFEVGASSAAGQPPRAIDVYASSYNASVKILGCYLKHNNSLQSTSGLYASEVTGQCKVEIVATEIEHTDAGASSDIASANAAEVYVRGVRYSTWLVSSGGQIIPLAGDRPRLESATDGTAFTITAGAGVWQTDPNITVTINLPCESDLKVDVALRWYSDTVRTTSFLCRALLDGATGSGSLGSVGVPIATTRLVYPLSVEFTGVPAGSHTIQLQYQRGDAGDTIVVATKQITVMSNPWP